MRRGVPVARPSIQPCAQWLYFVFFVPCKVGIVLDVDAAVILEPARKRETRERRQTQVAGRPLHSKRDSVVNSRQDKSLIPLPPIHARITAAAVDQWYEKWYTILIN